MQPQDFSQWTKEQWIEFDSIRQSTFEPTGEELEQEKIDSKNNLINQIKNILSQYWITFIWDEEDFTNLYSSYIKWWPDFVINWAMNEFLWSDLDKVLQDKITNYNNFNDFCNFVLTYQ